MGGNALAGYVRRHDSLEYFVKELAVVTKLQELFPTSRVRPVKAYSDKESFGDCDVLLESDNLHEEWMVDIIKAFNSVSYKKNGNVLSAEYKELQVDIITTKSEDFDSSAYYFDYNDLGNLVGRIAHNLCLKLGHDGLSYCWRVDTYKFKELVLLKDWKDILPVLGYSYERYKQGFKTLDEMFDFVVSSPFFYKDIYLLQNRNHVSRVRDAKRKTYNEFLTWIESYRETPTQRFRGTEIYCKPGVEGKDKWLPYLFRNIKGFKEQYDQTQVEYEQELEFRNRFNGNRVKALLGLEGKELGEFMKWIKIEKTEERLRKDVLAMNPVLIDRWITYYVDKWRKEIGY